MATQKIIVNERVTLEGFTYQPGEYELIVDSRHDPAEGYVGRRAANKLIEIYRAGEVEMLKPQKRKRSPAKAAAKIKEVVNVE